MMPSKQWCYIVPDGPHNVVVTEYSVCRLRKLAHVLLLEHVPGQLQAFLLQESGTDARHLGSWYARLTPALAGVPHVPEVATLPERGRGQYEPAVLDSQHRPDCLVQLIFHASGLILDQQGHGADTSDSCLTTWQAQDAAAASYAHAQAVIFQQVRLVRHLVPQLYYLAEQFTTLAL